MYKHVFVFNNELLSIARMDDSKQCTVNTSTVVVLVSVSTAMHSIKQHSISSSIDKA